VGPPGHQRHLLSGPGLSVSPVACARALHEAGYQLEAQGCNLSGRQRAELRRRQDHASSRHLAAVKALAQVRRLLRKMTQKMKVVRRPAAG
jgi:hypothetical protein